MERLNKPGIQYGRIVFGLSAVLFGVIALMWHDVDTWQSTRRLWSLPFGTLIGQILMVAQIAGGLGVLYPRTARPASIVLFVVYVIFTLACIPVIVQYPGTYSPYVGFFEHLALVVGAFAIYVVTEPNPTRAAALGRAARLGLGVCTVSFTLAQIFYLQFTASLVPKWIPPNQTFWAVLTTIAFGLAAIAILINVRARLAMRLMTLMLALFGLLVWVPLLIAHPEAHGNWSEFTINFLITGATWAVSELASF
jgi:uncharacterized membrane protein YphA (DoxX/SURF4 family)